jgi:hypothetical protein
LKAVSFQDSKLTGISGVVYFTTLATPTSKALLQSALDSLLSALGNSDETPSCLYQLYYQQSRGSSATKTDGKVLQLPAPSLGLAFDDSTLESVREAWKAVMGSEVEDSEYMVFSDREPADAYDDGDD